MRLAASPEYRLQLVRETAAQRIQAAYRGYQVRKAFLAVRLRFEGLVKSIDQISLVVKWPYSGLCYPQLVEDSRLVRLRELEAEEIRLQTELQETRRALQVRRNWLLSNSKSSAF